MDMSASENAGRATVVKCAGNHGCPRCDDPQCWNDGIEAWNAAVDARKQARHERRLGATTGRPIGKVEPKPGSAKPFKRAQAMYMEVLKLKVHQ